MVFSISVVKDKGFCPRLKILTFCLGVKRVARYSPCVFAETFTSDKEKVQVPPSFSSLTIPEIFLLPFLKDGVISLRMETDFKSFIIIL